jgi:lipopolysaccharide/colanic/teichoic acid biosynthesis glycosyltransferase
MQGALWRRWEKHCAKMGKRIFDLIASSVGLLLLAPLFFIIGVLIKIDSTGPIYFRQIRVGRYGIPFRIYKFRTMKADEKTSGILLTTKNDERITKVGLFLRKYKLDELPQLIDVFLGRMSLVGPRPEVPQYVSYYSEEAKKTIFSIRPGITDPTSIKFKDENHLLENLENAEETYIRIILPEKIRNQCDYARESSLLYDLKIIVQTMLEIAKMGAKKNGI